MITFCPETSTEFYFSDKGFLLKYYGFSLKTKPALDSFIKKLHDGFPDIKRHDITHDSILVGDNVVVNISRSGCAFDISGLCKDLASLEALARIGKEVYDTENVDVNIMVFDYYIDPRTGLCFDTNYLVMDSLPSTLYVPYINTEVMFEQFFKSSENILLLTGKSGVGKSKLSSLAIDYLSKHTKKVNANIASASDVNVLSSDGFWSYLITDQIDLVILDDLDFMLTPRSEEQGVNDVTKNRFVSNFLSFTDGFKKNNVKFIITTNQSVDTIDTSLLRKGRMFDILELRELTNNEAKVVWNAYVKDVPFTLKGSVLACDLAHEIETAKASFEKQNYLKDSKVSRLENVTKTIGF